MIFLLIAALFGLTLWLYLLRFRGVPPGPWGLPIVGYLPWLTGSTPHLKLTALASKYGPIYSLRMGSVFTVVLSDPRLIREAFASETFTGRAPLYLTHGIMKNNGIICVQGEKWKETRKFIATSLRSLGMVKFGPGRGKMESCILKGVDEAVRGLNESRGVPQDPEPVLIHVLGNVLFRLVFGRDWEEDDPVWKKLQSLQEEGTKLIGVSAVLNFLPFLRFLPMFQRTVKYLTEGIEFSHNIYQDILRDYDEKSPKLNQGEPVPHLMGAYVERMKQFGAEGLYNKVQFNYLMADIFGAGVDTTSATLRWFILFMALNPDWQDRVQEELDELTEGHSLVLDLMPRAPIFEACIWETQRIRSVVPVGIPHGTIKDTELGGYRIPAGSMVMPLQWAVHMDPTVYDAPENFNPSRFLEADGTLVKSPPHFIPFQTGKRMCVGDELAKMILFLFGGTILLNFQISIPQGAILDLGGEPGITLNPPHHELIFITRK